RALTVMARLEYGAAPQYASLLRPTQGPVLSPPQRLALDIERVAEAAAALLVGVEALLQPVEKTDLRPVAHRQTRALQTAAAALLPPQRMPMLEAEILA